jgi:NADH:ubiquinone oxidoreductase subunit H
MEIHFWGLIHSLIDSLSCLLNQPLDYWPSYAQMFSYTLQPIIEIIHYLTHWHTDTIIHSMIIQHLTFSVSLLTDLP